jgi:hypothetical protein
MNEIGTEVNDKSFQSPGLKERERRLLAEVKPNMLTAFLNKLVNQSSAGRNDNTAVPAGDKGLANLERTSLDAAAFQLGENLDDSERTRGHLERLLSCVTF